MQAKITKRVVDGAVSGPATYLIRDAELKGFVLVVTPAGTKSYAVDYRAGGGRRAPKRRYTIGKHGSPWTPEQARREAAKLLGDVARGGDPAKQRAAERTAVTFSELIDLYLVEGVGHKKPSTLKSDRGRIEHHLRPRLGKLPIEKITRADIERMRDAIERHPVLPGPKRGRGAVPSGGKGVAAQCVLLASTILSFAIDRRLRADNPARGIKKASVRKLERFLSETEIGRLADALASEANPFPVAAIRLLLFTGCRKGEILGLQWQHVDFDHACLRLPDSKTGAKVVYLNAPALELLSVLPRVDGNPHVIPGERAGAAYRGLDKVWGRVRKVAGLTGVRLHDLRHSFASIGAAGGSSLPIIGALLGHRTATTTERYAHLSADPLRTANEMVGARIAAAMAGGTANSKVISMRRPS